MSLDEIRALDVSERILLVEEIWDTRLNHLQENTNAQSSWAKMKEKIRA